MSEQQNLDIVRQGYAAFGRGDIQGLINLLDPQVTWTTPGGAEVPMAGTRHGHAAVGEFFATLASSLEITRFEPRDFLAQGDKVVVLGDDTSIVRATGKSIDFRWVHVHTVRNGKIVSVEEIGDMTAMAAEFRSAQARV
jgi:ketosteroid isomerase-like protein